MLQLIGVSKEFSIDGVTRRKALDRVDLSVGRGEFVTIAGTNGAGKSTLFGVISGAVRPDAGRVLIAGQDVTAAAEHVRARLVARVFQDPMAGTAPNLTVEENLALALQRGRRRGLGPGVRRREIAGLRGRLAEVGLGLEDRMRQKVGTLSGGQRQVLALIMATVRRLEILLLDEPTAALDPRTAQVVADLIVRIVREMSLTALMITHDLGQVLDLGTRTILVDSGRVVLDVSGEGRAKMGVDDILGLLRRGAQAAADAATPSKGSAALGGYAHLPFSHQQQARSAQPGSGPIWSTTERV